MRKDKKPWISSSIDEEYRLHNFLLSSYTHSIRKGEASDLTLIASQIWQNTEDADTLMLYRPHLPC